MKNKRARLLVVSLGKILNGTLHLYVADRWPTRTSPVYNCEVANPDVVKDDSWGTHQWQSALSVVGLPVIHDWFEMGCRLSLA